MTPEALEARKIWAGWCRQQGVDPGEVQVVFGRYSAYCSYYQGGRHGEALSLKDWFTFYRMEAASEADQASPTASECSVDPNAPSRGSITRPAQFFEALSRLIALEAAAHGQP